MVNHFHPLDSLVLAFGVRNQDRTLHRQWFRRPRPGDADPSRSYTSFAPKPPCRPRFYADALHLACCNKPCIWFFGATRRHDEALSPYYLSTLNAPPPLYAGDGRPWHTAPLLVQTATYLPSGCWSPRPPPAASNATRSSPLSLNFPSSVLPLRHAYVVGTLIVR